MYFEQVPKIPDFTLQIYLKNLIQKKNYLKFILLITCTYLLEAIWGFRKVVNVLKVQNSNLKLT